MANVTRDELNARFGAVDSKLSTPIDAMRVELSASRTETLRAVREEVLRLRTWVLTGAVAALCSFLGLVVTNVPIMAKATAGGVAQENVKTTEIDKVIRGATPAERVVSP